MEEPKYRKFYVDWWKIRKSTIYSIVAVILLAVGVAVGGWWLSKQSWAVGADTAEIPKDAARIISFEGDVRITRAATRETILVTKETFVAAGDTIQTQADGRRGRSDDRRFGLFCPPEQHSRRARQLIALWRQERARFFG